jgi:hypothetical protein
LYIFTRSGSRPICDNKVFILFTRRLALSLPSR